MQEQRVFVAVVVVGASLTAVGFFLSTFSTSSLFPARSRLLKQNDQSPNSSPNSKNLYHIFTGPPSAPPPSAPPYKKSNSTSPPSKDSPLPSPSPQPPFSLASSLSPTPHLPYINPVLEELKDRPEVFKDEPVNITDTDGKRFKIILYWNEAYGNKHFGLGYGRKPFLLAGCRVNTCVATGDRTRYPLSQVDAVLWHLRSNDRSLPKERYPHTRYIFWMMESASYPFSDLRRYRGVFNMTFTYRRNSDIYNPYNRVFLRRHPLPVPSSPVNYAEGKTKMAAWFVSNCHTKSGREKLVDLLQRWISVDIYGKCGSLKCDRSIHGECLAMLEKDYKFYLSFENSLCLDYVTEKFFGALSVNVVPVVWGLGNYSAIAPPHSYIDALKFPTAHHLAEYLQYLDSNDTAYNEYFRWKRYYHQTHDWAKKSMAFCDLCEQLHKDPPPKTYDLDKWFIEDSHCLQYSSASIQKYIHVGITQSFIFRLSIIAIVFLSVLFISGLACSAFIS